MVAVGVVGSRYFHNYELIRAELLKWQENNKLITKIISGGASGVDWLAARFAHEFNIEFKDYPANWSQYGKSAGPIRNRLIVKASEYVIAFPAPDSCGTWSTINIARELSIPVTIIYI